MTENDIIVQIALNEKLAESADADIARTAQKMVTYWEGRLADRRAIRDVTLDDLA